MDRRNWKNRTEGITLVALSVMIVILLILAGIGIYTGRNTIKKAELEELKTNMLLIQAKAKEYVEDATFKMGINEPSDEKKIDVRKRVYGNETEEGAQLQKATKEEIPDVFAITEEQKETCYWLTEATQKKWGLSKIKLVTNEKYLIQFNEEDMTVEVYNTKGYEGNYSLTAMEQIIE